MPLESIVMKINGEEIRVAFVASIAMALNFFWFDLPGHGFAFLERDLLLRVTYVDGHTLFLIGMFLVSLCAAVFPRWFETNRLPALSASAVLGTAAAIVQFSEAPLEVCAVANLVTGFTNVHLLIADVLILPRLTDRKVIGISVVLVFVLRSLFMYAADTVLTASGEVVLYSVLPCLCAVFTFWAMRILKACTLNGAAVAPFKFEKPLSTAMFGLLILSSVTFAVACAVGSTGFWGNPFALTNVGLAGIGIGSALFFALAYVTLVKTEASLLLRFMPGLLVLFIAYSFLYLGSGSLLGFSQTVFSTAAHFAECYGEAFSWFVILLAVQTLDMRPYRIVGISFCVNSGMTVVFQYMIIFDSNSDLMIVQMGFFVMLAVLVWALYHFYGIGNSFRDARCAKCACNMKAAGSTSFDAAAGAMDNAEPHPGFVTIPNSPGTDLIQSLAGEHGLSERETDVFLLLARGHSRRFICDTLFIADGTASTHISRIYEKMGVRSKQELLQLVQESEATCPEGHTVMNSEC